MERVMGIEPTLAAWEAAVLPLNYTRDADILGAAWRAAQPDEARRKNPRSSERVQVFHERCDRAIQPLHLRVGRLDEVVLVGRMRAGAVSHAEVARGQAERCVGEHAPRPGPGRARPQQRIDTELPVRPELCLYEAAVRIRLGRVVAAAHVGLDVAEA